MNVKEMGIKTGRFDSSNQLNPEKLEIIGKTFLVFQINF